MTAPYGGRGRDDVAEIRITPARDAEPFYDLDDPREESCVELDLRTGELSVQHYDADRSGTPSDVWHGHVRQIEVPAMSAQAYNELLEAIRRQAQAAVDAYSSGFDGSNTVAEFDGGYDEDEDGPAVLVALRQAVEENAWEPGGQRQMAWIEEATEEASDDLSDALDRVAAATPGLSWRWSGTDLEVERAYPSGSVYETRFSDAANELYAGDLSADEIEADVDAAIARWGVEEQEYLDDLAEDDDEDEDDEDGPDGGSGPDGDGPAPTTGGPAVDLEAPLHVATVPVRATQTARGPRQAHVRRQLKR